MKYANHLSLSLSLFSLCRPRTPNTMVTIDGPSTMIRPRSPTEVSRDSGRPRSPTDLSQVDHLSLSLSFNLLSYCQLSRPGRPGSIIRPRSPTNTSQISVVVASRYLIKINGNFLHSLSFEASFTYESISHVWQLHSISA